LLQFGVGRKPGYLVLKNLEAAGLVQVCRHVGKSPIVTICLKGKPIPEIERSKPPLNSRNGGRYLEWVKN
jgi:hypothetical protein